MLVFTAVVLLSLVVLGVASYRAASEMHRQQALQQLRMLRVNAARDIERYLGRLEADVAGLADDPRTLAALKQFSAATENLDDAPLTEPARMRPQMESLKRFLEDYYRAELGEKTLDLRALLVPQRSAVWLQAAYLARGIDPTATQYAHVHALWDPILRSVANRFGIEDIYLVDTRSGRILYSVRKRPDFQTSLVDGPYAAGSLGALFRQLQTANDDARYRIIDFAPYPPTHGTPAAFAGAPLVDDGRIVGALIVQLSSEPLTRILSGSSQWSEVGLGDTGELYLVGRGDDDSLMRSDSRFGPVGPAPPSAGMYDQSTVLHQRVMSAATVATNHADEYQSEYVSYRGVPVLGSAGWLAHLNGLNWTLIAELSSAEAMRPVFAVRSHTGWIAGFLLVGVLVLSIGVTAAIAPSRRTTQGATASAANTYQDRIKAELRPVVTAVTAASEGDLSQQITLDSDVLGDLPQRLNRLWRNISAIVTRVSGTSTAAIESAQQIQTAVRQLSAEAIHHATECAGATTLLRHAQSRRDALVADATLVSQTEDSIAAAAQQGAAATAHAVTGMEDLQKHTRALSMKMKRLGERSMEISTLTTTIQEITAEANMLALNATIEASRAGEHGIGFKTVANSVRKLAARTEATAQQMVDGVAVLHSEAADAVDCIEQQAEHIERQASIVADANHALSHCRDAIEANRERFSVIAAAAAEQTRTAEQMSTALRRIGEFIRRTHILSEQAVHSSAALLSMLSEVTTWARTFRVRNGSDTSASSPTHAEVIELAQHEAVGNGRGVGV